MGTDHPQTLKFDQVRYGLSVYTTDTPQRFHDQARASGVREVISILESAVFELQNFDPEIAAKPAKMDPDGTIFVVHGHDLGRVAETRLALGQLTGNDAVVLHAQPNGGKTVIEKFESHAGAASFAVAILTPDDLGRAKSEEELQPRARQNVLFEAGYFMGKLGRDRVVILHEPEVEIPSDLSGVLFCSFGHGNGWKSELAKELNAAGMAADSNQLA